METIVEIIELVLEAISELGTNKKTPKWIRYPMLAIIIIFSAIIIFGLIIYGFYIITDHLILGTLLIAVGSVLLIYAIRKFKIMIEEEKNNSEIPKI